MSKAHSALGRGLGALISGSTSESEPPSPTHEPTHEPSDKQSDSAAARWLPIDRIDRNPDQPRRVFDPAQLTELANSIRLHGVLQPVVVRRAGERYELLVGERRWRACREAGLDTIPAVVADVASPARLEIAIVENVQRQDLNPIELAHAYEALRRAGSTQEEIGRRVAKDRSSVANHLRLLELSNSLQQDLEQGRLSMGHAKALLQVKDERERASLRDRVVSGRLSVRATERLARRLASGVPVAAERPKAAPSSTDPQLRALQEELERRFQTRVKMIGNATRGKIEIQYFDASDLMRVSDLLLGTD